MSKVLIVEDQAPVAKALTVLLEIHGIPCTVASGPEEAMLAVGRGDVDVVVQDMNFSPGETSGEEGMELFRRLRRADPGLPVLVLTAWTSLETAVQMVKDGASDYLAKPWDDTKLLASVQNLVRMREGAGPPPRAAAGRSYPREGLASRFDLCGLLYESETMHRVVSLAVQVASADVPVLITGPNGAGKEKIAEIVQANSRRRGGPFLKVNVSALPDDLLESELFGAEAGAYTGSTRRRIGRFGAAHGGTLFLDEIGNLSPAGQMKVLRVLQSGEFEPLGSSETQRVDVRVLAATNVDLRDALAHGRFREDLYFRLNVIEIAVPSLAERIDDVIPLATSFLARFAAAAAQAGAAPGRGPDGGPAGTARTTFSPAALEALRAHPWPGNVRELMNRVQRAHLVGAGHEIGPDDLGLAGALEGSGPEDAEAGAPEPILDLLAGPGGGSAERARIQEALRAARGNVSDAAAGLGVSRQALYRRMARLGIVMERRPRDE
jgi:DNA-binding NtrC family response regulator